MQNLSRMDWEDLRTAAALAHAGTFAGAAAKLGVDATTVARRIARLEAAFPAPLFHAVDGRRRPTAQGVEILAHVEAMSAHAAAIRSVAPGEGGISGHIRIAATASICDRILAPHAADLLGDRPGLTLTILASDANVDFSRYETDMAIRLARPERGGFIIRRLASIPLALYEPAEPRTEAETIVCAYPDHLDATPETRELDRIGMKAKARFYSNSASAIRSVLGSGRAAAILPALGDDPDDAPSLRRAEIGGHREAWLLIQPHLKKDAAARLVASWISGCFDKALAAPRD